MIDIKINEANIIKLIAEGDARILIAEFMLAANSLYKEFQKIDDQVAKNFKEAMTADGSPVWQIKEEARAPFKLLKSEVEDAKD